MRLFTFGTNRTTDGAFRGRAPYACLAAILAALLLAAFEKSAGAGEPDIVYARGTLGAWAEPDGAGKPFARLFVVARLRVLERRGGWLRVETRGWNREGAERVVYAFPGKRILTVALRRTETGRLNALDRIVDPETGIAWNGVALEGWIADKHVTPDLDTIWQAAWDLFATRCTVCHQRRVPHHYTANQWVSLLKVMGPRTGLPKERQRLILTYLQHHARDTAGETKP